jgi:glycerate kinase
MPLKDALDNAEDLYYKGAIRMFRFLKAGMEMKK